MHREGGRCTTTTTCLFSTGGGEHGQEHQEHGLQAADALGSPAIAPLAFAYRCELILGSSQRCCRLGPEHYPFCYNDAVYADEIMGKSILCAWLCHFLGLGEISPRDSSCVIERSSTCGKSVHMNDIMSDDEPAGAISRQETHFPSLVHHCATMPGPHEICGFSLSLRRNHLAGSVFRGADYLKRRRSSNVHRLQRARDSMAFSGQDGDTFEFGFNEAFKNGWVA